MDRIWQFLIGLGGAVLLGQLFDIWRTFDYFLWLLNETIFGFQKAYPQYAEVLPPVITLVIIFFVVLVISRY